MSHHSVESMRDVAFRKGRHGFGSGDDYLRALRGEELADDEAFEIDEEFAPHDGVEDGFEDEEDESLDGEDGLEDKPLDEDEATRHQDDFESFLDDLLTIGYVDAINRLFDWIIEYDAGNRNIGVAVVRGDTTMYLQPDVDGETPYELKFKLARKGEEDMVGGYDFADLVDYLGQILDDEESPFVRICHMIGDALEMADRHGDLGDVWRGRITDYLAHKPTETEAVCGLVLKSMGGEALDAYLEFRRKSRFPDGDIVWVSDDPPGDQHFGKGCPTVLLRWLLCNHKGLL